MPTSPKVQPPIKQLRALSCPETKKYRNLSSLLTGPSASSITYSRCTTSASTLTSSFPRNDLLSGLAPRCSPSASFTTGANCLPNPSYEAPQSHSTLSHPSCIPSQSPPHLCRKKFVEVFPSAATAAEEESRQISENSIQPPLPSNPIGSLCSGAHHHGKSLRRVCFPPMRRGWFIATKFPPGRKHSPNCLALSLARQEKGES